MDFVEKKAKDLYKSNSGLSKSADQFGFGYPFLSYSDIFHNFFVPDVLTTLVNSSEKDRSNCSIKRGDVFLTRTSETTDELGMSCVALRDVPNGTFNGFAKRLRPIDDEIVPEYAAYFFRSPYFRAQCMSMASLITRASLNDGMIGRLKIQYPKSTDVQRRIGQTLMNYDNLIEVNNKRIKVLEQMAENLYKEWFVRFRFPGHENAEFENGLPKGWELKTVDNYFKISIGKTPPRKEFDWFTSNDSESVNWVSISDMKSIVILDTKEQLTQSAIKRFNMIIVPENTILLSFKLTVGRVSLTTCKCATNEAIAHFLNVPKICREYLFLYLKEYDYSRLGNTSAIGNAVNSKIVKSMKFIMPDKEILKLFSNKIKPLIDSIINLTLLNNNLIKQRNLLLPHLMSGNLEVSNVR